MPAAVDPSGGTRPDVDPTAAPSSDDVFEVQHLTKRFGAVVALSDINLHLGRGEVLGLLGDNGAGKSTLVKALCGFHRPDSGRILLDGEPITLRSVTHARSLGIDIVYQDLALVNELSVFHNMFLNREPVRFRLLRNRTMRRLAREHLDSLGISTVADVGVEVAKLSGGQRQAIAVARAVFSEAKVLLLDEPLAAMGAREGALILDLIQDLRATGRISIIVIAHNYAQILEVCDRVNVLQHGRITFDKRASDTSLAELTDLMVTEYRAARARQNG